MAEIYLDQKVGSFKIEHKLGLEAWIHPLPEDEGGFHWIIQREDVDTDGNQFYFDVLDGVAPSVSEAQAAIEQALTISRDKDSYEETI